VKKSLEGVNAKIEDRAKAIETLSSPDAARQQVDALQALISQTLGLVADNGAIATLGAKALEYSRGKQDQMRKDTKFSPTERAELQRRWALRSPGQEEPCGDGDAHIGQHHPALLGPDLTTRLCSRHVSSLKHRVIIRHWTVPACRGNQRKLQRYRRRFWRTA